jgi:hypothetical protein
MEGTEMLSSAGKSGVFTRTSTGGAKQRASGAIYRAPEGQGEGRREAPWNQCAFQGFDNPGRWKRIEGQARTNTGPDGEMCTAVLMSMIGGNRLAQWLWDKGRPVQPTSMERHGQGNTEESQESRARWIVRAADGPSG